MIYPLLALSLACFASFSWGIVRLFARPNRISNEMRILSLFGILFSIAQIVFIATTQRGALRSGSAASAYVTALCLFWWAVPHAAKAHLSVAFSRAKPDGLLVSGPYHYVRHPFYASYFLYWIAGALISSWLWTTVLVMGSFYFAAMNREEKSFQHSPWAALYSDYRLNTGALFPVLRLKRRAHY